MNHNYNYIYHAGDQVIVRDDLKFGEIYDSLDQNERNAATRSMVELCGKVVTIVGTRGGQYTVFGNDCYWVDAMFLGLAEDYSTDEDVQLHGLESLI